MHESNETMEEAIAIFDERAWTIPEAADELRKSVTVIRRYIEGGVFENAYKDGATVGSRWLIPQRDIDTYKEKVVTGS